jgi:hypothetical protein
MFHFKQLPIEISDYIYQYVRADAVRQHKRKYQSVLKDLRRRCFLITDFLDRLDIDFNDNYYYITEKIEDSKLFDIYSRRVGLYWNFKVFKYYKMAFNKCDHQREQRKHFRMSLFKIEDFDKISLKPIK